MLTTQFFAMKIQRYMHDYGISNDALIRVAEKAFHNGSLNPDAWRTTALSYFLRFLAGNPARRG